MVEMMGQCQDNVTEWGHQVILLAARFPLRQHYKIAMSVYCRKSVPILTWCMPQV